MILGASLRPCRIYFPAAGRGERETLCSFPQAPISSMYSLQETYKLPHRLIEKKRRDRINECIAQLKDLLPEHLKLTVSEKLAALQPSSSAQRADGGHSPPAGVTWNCRLDGWIKAPGSSGLEGTNPSPVPGPPGRGRTRTLWGLFKLAPTLEQLPFGDFFHRLVVCLTERSKAHTHARTRTIKLFFFSTFLP